MNEFFIMVGVGLVAVAGFVLYNLRVGFNANLAEAKTGEMYRFKYLQPVTGKAERYMVRILDNRVMSTEQINRLNANSYRRNDPLFIRTGHLITGQCGDGTIRNFYAERTIECKKTIIPNVLNRIGIL